MRATNGGGPGYGSTNYPAFVLWQCGIEMDDM